MPDAPNSVHAEYSMNLADDHSAPRAVKPVVGKIENGPYQNFDPNARIPLSVLIGVVNAKDQTVLV